MADLLGQLFFPEEFGEASGSLGLELRLGFDTGGGPTSMGRKGAEGKAWRAWRARESVTEIRNRCQQSHRKLS